MYVFVFFSMVDCGTCFLSQWYLLSLLDVCLLDVCLTNPLACIDLFSGSSASTLCSQLQCQVCLFLLPSLSSSAKSVSPSSLFFIVFHVVLLCQYCCSVKRKLYIQLLLLQGRYDLVISSFVALLLCCSTCVLCSLFFIGSSMDKLSYSSVV